MKGTRSGLSLFMGLLLGAAVVTAADAHDITFDVVDGGIPVSLSGAPGDPANGRKLAIHRKKGNCLACHTMPVAEQPFHGEIAPDLEGVGSRFSEAVLRLRIADPKRIVEDTMMPAYYRDTGLFRVNKGFRKKSMLTAQEVEDIVAYLMTLKD